LTDALTIVESRLADLDAASAGGVDGVAPPSLAMAEYLRGGPPAKEKNPRGPDFAGVVAAAVEGRLDAPAAAKRLESVELVAPTPPSETVLLRAAGKAAADRSAADLKTLLQRRLAAEAAAVPGGLRAAAVFPWVRGRVNRADALRRPREDKYFATAGSKEVAVGKDAPPAASTADEEAESYQAASSDGARLAGALEIRERLLADVPPLLALASHRPWQQSADALDDDLFAKTLKSDLETLLDGLRELDRRLRADPSGWDAEQARRELVVVEQSAADLDKLHREKILPAVRREMVDLGGASGSAATQEEWRRIDRILAAPTPAHPEDPVRSAAVRVRLLQRAASPAAQQGSTTPPAAGDRPTAIATQAEELRRNRLARIARLAKRWLAIGRDGAFDGSVAPDGVEVATRWRERYALAFRGPRGGEDDLPLLLRGETAQRLLEG
ncbi:MAG: hypothetical protein ACRDD1_07445, partial [Planctomycetia bacterium]